MLKLCLGTVQFGMKYGINNQIYRQPTKEEVYDMLDYAIENGINVIDTARAYGNAEEILGQYFERRKGVSEKVNVISKMPPNSLDINENVEEKIVNECKESLHRMHLNKLKGYLLHTPQYIYNKQVLSGLQKLKEKQLVENIGVSIYDLKEGIAAIETGIIDYIQLPYSILDQRGSKSGFFEKAKNADINIFVRSVFLQGLFMMDEKNIPEHLKDVIPYIRIFEDTRKKYALSKVEAIISFIKEEKEIDYLVFGVEKKGQLVEDIRVFERSYNNTEDFVKEIKEKIDDVDKSIIFPSLWSNGKKAELD
ncbi:oxidoreductase [Clostridium sp. CAG:253]|nr:oxidoreductase [Clostridium sp. CAG:253]